MVGMAEAKKNTLGPWEGHRCEKPYRTSRGKPLTGEHADRARRLQAALRQRSEARVTSRFSSWMDSAAMRTGPLFLGLVEHRKERRGTRPKDALMPLPTL